MACSRLLRQNEAVPYIRPIDNWSVLRIITHARTKGREWGIQGWTSTERWPWWWEPPPASGVCSRWDSPGRAPTWSRPGAGCPTSRRSPARSNRWAAGPLAWPATSRMRLRSTPRARPSNRRWDASTSWSTAPGRTKRTPTLDVPEAEWNAILDTNLTGTLRACRSFGRAHARARLRPHRQHRLARVVRRPVRGGRLHRQQGRRGRPDAGPGRRVGPARRERERHRARRLPHGPQPGAARRHAARAGVPDPHAPGRFGTIEELQGAGRLPGLGRRQLRERRGAGGGRRLPGQRRQSDEDHEPRRPRHPLSHLARSRTAPTR